MRYKNNTCNQFIIKIGKDGRVTTATIEHPAEEGKVSSGKPRGRPKKDDKITTATMNSSETKVYPAKARGRPVGSTNRPKRIGSVRTSSGRLTSSEVGSGKSQGASSGRVVIRRPVGGGKADRVTSYKCAPCNLSFATDELIKAHVALYHSV